MLRHRGTITIPLPLRLAGLVYAALALACASGPRAATTAPTAAAPTTTADERYLFSSFKGNGEDGLTWRALNHDSAFFRPTVGKEKLTRDPSIVRGPDGTYHMVWTAGWNEHGFGYARSKDLITWTDETYVPVMAH